MTPPRFVRVLVQPRAVFQELARANHGYGHLFLFLLVEYVLRDTAQVAVSLARLSFDSGGGLASLFAGYRNAALVPALVVYGAGLVTYYAWRRTPRRLEHWTAASVLAYAWVPHTVVLAIGLLLARLGFDHIVLPQHSVAGAQGTLVLAKLGIAYGPSLLYASLALQAVRSIPTSEQSSRMAWPALAILSLLLATTVGLQVRNVVAQWQGLRPVSPQDPLPHFTVRAIDDGTPWTPAARHELVTLIDFWATWCPPCVAALPHLAELHTELKGQGLQTISINTEPDNLEAVRAFVRERALPFPVYVDNGNAQMHLKVESLPTLLIVDRRGTIRHVHTGSVSMQTVRREVEKLLGANQ